MSAIPSLAGHLLLWRHATAEEQHANGDLARRLTHDGEAEARAAAEWIAALLERHGLRLQAVASPATRTQQTMAALTDGYAVDSALAPGATGDDYIEAARRWLSDADTALVLAGHQPSIGEAVAQLMFGAPASVSVKRGAVWWFVLRADANEDASIALRGVYSPH